MSALGQSTSIAERRVRWGATPPSYRVRPECDSIAQLVECHAKVIPRQRRLVSLLELSWDFHTQGRILDQKLLIENFGEDVA